MKDEFKLQIEAMVQRHGSTKFVEQVLEELKVPYVDDVADGAFFLKRCEAIKEEND